MVVVICERNGSKVEESVEKDKIDTLRIDFLV